MSENSEKHFGEYKKNRGGKPGQSFPNRLLQALAKIFEDPDSSVAEKLQALELSAKVLPMRPPVRRKSEKEKIIIEALKKKRPQPKGSEPEDSR